MKLSFQNLQLKVLKKLKFAFRLSIKVVTKSFESFYKVDFVLNKN